MVVWSERTGIQMAGGETQPRGRSRTAWSFAEALSNFVRVVDDSSRLVPRWMVPLIILLWTGFVAVACVVLFPYKVLHSLLPSKPDPMELLRTHVEGVWRVGNPRAALAIVRDTHRELLDSVRKRPWGRKRIAPYGKMGMDHFLQLAMYRYYCERRLGEQLGALEACDSVLAFAGEEQPPDPRRPPWWQLRKAEALVALGGRGAAIEYLMRMRNPAAPVPQIEEHLRQLHL
ncbi:MAG: hypothetical protein P1V51_12620 [Deltaproteobacteria bacterium]|nr:hypothetical protein [Deltaproteobacteria bacterium]